VATVVWTPNKSLGVRRNQGTTTEGASAIKRIYVGRVADNGYDYKYYLTFALDWTGVGRITSAVLTLYTDDGLGIEGDTLGPTSTPSIIITRLLADYAASGGSTVYTPSEYVSPVSATGSKAVAASPSPTALEAVNIDITGIVEDWAPATVQKRDGSAGGGASNFGVAIDHGTQQIVQYHYAGVSDDAEGGLAAYEPILTLTYSLGLTVPATPTSLTPVGAVAAIGSFQGAFSDADPNDKLAASQVEVYTAAASAAGQVVTGGTRLYNVQEAASNTEILNGIFDHVPLNLNLAVNTTFKWRARVQDSEGQYSLWTDLISFSLTNTNPTAPTLTPAAQTYASLDGIQFRGGTFSDPDAGDKLLAYEVQMSAYPEGNPNWNDPTFLLWVTGKRYVASGSTSWSTPYGGASLAAGTYYWRARHWDTKHGVSTFAYTSIILSADFKVEAQSSTNAIQERPRPRHRIVIREMEYLAVGGALTGVAATNLITAASAHGFAAGRPVRFSALTGGAGLAVGTTYYVIASGLTTTAFKVSATSGGTEVNFTTDITAGTVTAVTTRGPGKVVATLEDALNIGASILYNSPGEAHWTLGIAHPQLSVIEPRQTHYAIELYQGDGWREVFAGLVVDFDATDRDVVFYGIDYLGLLDFSVDEAYDPSNVDRPAESGGSKYITTNFNSINYIVTDQLLRARTAANSLVGFITTGAIAAMTETLTSYSTYQPTLNYIVGLLDSHRSGTGKYTRLSVQKKTGGGYEWVVQDAPGIVRDNLRMRYGELVQGYRVKPFGSDWASRIAAVGRDQTGVKVRYQTKTGPGIDEAIWGRWARPMFFDGLTDANDLTRRTSQAATAAGKLGKDVGLGLRSGVLQPRDGFDVCDVFPVDIEHGSVSTDAFGSGYWVALGITWVVTQKGDSTTILTLRPREDTVAPDTDLLTLQPISSQAEWQIGWQPPNPLSATSLYWLDQNTGQVYVREDGWAATQAVTGVASTDLFAKTGHGYVAGDGVVFGSLVGGVGIIAGTVYVVIASGLTADNFRVSATAGGSTINFTTDLTSGTVTRAARYNLYSTPGLLPSSASNEKLQLGIGGANMLANAGFEFDFQGWTTSATPPIIQTDVDPYEGRKRWAVTVSAAYRWANATTMTFKAGRTYTASFWMIASGGATSDTGAGIVFEGLSSVALTHEDGTTATATPRRLLTVLPTSWTRYSVTWLQAADDTSGMVVTNAYGGNSTGTIAIDAIVVEQSAIATTFAPGPMDLRNTEATVVIDSTGLTIENGKLFLKDEFGATAFDANGIQGSIADYILLNIYNGHFRIRPAADGTAIADGRNAALPFWTISRTGSPAVTIETEAVYVGLGNVIQFAPAVNTDTFRAVTDLSQITDGRRYLVELGFVLKKATYGGGGHTVAGTAFFYKADRITAASTASQALTGHTTTTAGTIVYASRTLIDPPADARFVKVQIDLSTAGTRTAGDYIRMDGAALLPSIPIEAVAFRRNLNNGADAPKPTNPRLGDRFWLEGSNLEFFYNGTRWVTTTLYTGEMSFQRTLNPAAANTAIDGLPPHPTLDVWVETVFGKFFVATTNDGSNYWDIVGASVPTFTLSTISNAPNAWVQESVADNAVVAAGSSWGATITKVGAPGSIYVTLGYTYRLIAP
jgi:hypothetical protein